MPARLFTHIISRSAAALAVGAAALFAWAAPASATTAGGFDPSFGTGGVVALQFGQGPQPQSQVNAIQALPHGRVLIAGFATDQNGQRALLVARLRRDGTLDPSYGQGGKLLLQLGNGASADSEANTLLALPHGKLLVGGEAQGDTEHGFVVARLTRNGRLDCSFGQGGLAYAPLPAGGPELPIIYTLALQPDGKILAGGAGEFTDVGAHSTTQFFVTRLWPSGALDTSFGQQGEVLQQLAPPSLRLYSEAHALALQPNGKILVAGFAGGELTKGLVVRLSRGGAFDPTFGSGGQVTIAPAGSSESDSRFFGIELAPHHRLLASGFGASFSGDSASAGLFSAELDLSGGTLVPSFGQGGRALTPVTPNTILNALAFDPAGRVVVGGFQFSDQTELPSYLVARALGPAGPLDPGFGTGGVVAANPASSSSSTVTAIAIDHAGRILAVGAADSRALITRLLG